MVQLQIFDLPLGGDLERLLQRFLIPIISLAGAKAGAVRVLDDDGIHMRLVAYSGLPPILVESEREVKRDCGVCGRATCSDVLEWISDHDPCAQHDNHSFFRLQCQGVLAISLLHGDSVLGIYNLFFPTRIEIPAATESILRLIGQLLGLALHNARVERERMRITVLKERQDMVNEVHDAIAQTLAYVKMRLPLLSDAMLAHDDSSSLKYFTDVKLAVNEVHDNLREVMTYFRTRMDPLGLLHALQGIADSYFDRTGIQLEIRNSEKNLHLSDAQEVQVFHIVQEALANIAKHSMARRAVVTISKSTAWLEFLIEDDGLGLNAPSVSTIITMARESSSPTTAAHLGMEIMQGRARRLGGSIEIGNNGEEGTRVCLRIPLRETSLGTQS